MEELIFDAFGERLHIGDKVKFFYVAPKRRGLYEGYLRGWNHEELTGCIESLDYDMYEYGIPQFVRIHQRELCK